MKTENLESVARKLVAAGRGILAADESSPTIEKRLKSIGVASTEENRRAYRDVLFTTAGAGEFISGVILFDETIRQKTRDGDKRRIAGAVCGTLSGSGFGADRRTGSAYGWRAHD